jgi:hypothetical protein
MCTMAIHPLHALGFEPVAPHRLAELGFAPATVTIGTRAAGRLVVQPTADPAVNQALATQAMPAYTAQLASIAAAIPGATLAATRPAKKPGRLAAKIMGQGQPPETVSDYGAAQIAVTSVPAKEAVVAAVQQQFPVLRQQDRFAAGDPAYHYHSESLQVQMPNQSSEELQIVPQEVWAANLQEHHTYKHARDAALAGKPDRAAQAAAQAQNDAAMQAFAARNAGKVARDKVVKGARVHLADGAVARVVYVDPNMRIVRVRTEDGRNVTVRRKDLR